MSLKANVLANYASQFYIALIGILMVPVLLRYMGAEAYGLVGFFTMLQGWFQVLDLGFAAAMSREAARARHDAASGGELRVLLRKVEQIFGGMGLLGVLAIVAGAPVVAERWLRLEALGVDEVRQAVALMMLAALLRWVSGLYRGIIAGMERQVGLSIFGMLIATLRFVLVVPVLVLVDAGPVTFFSYQLGIALFELAALVWMAYRLLPGSSSAPKPWRSGRFDEVLRFSVAMAVASAVWALATQTDKLVLSRMLPLSDFGYFSIAAAVAGVVLLVATPVSTAILPRLSRLEFHRDITGSVALYRDATQLVAVLAGSVALVLALFAEQLLWLWTGDAAAVAKAAPVLALYAAGSGFLVLGAFPYYLQHAKGDLRIHLVGSLLFVATMVPMLIWATQRYGMVGAGWTWLITNLLYFALWVPVAHRLFLRGMHVTWLVQDVAMPIAPAALCALVLRSVLPWTQDRIGVAVELAGVGGLLVFSAGCGSRTVRRYWRAFRGNGMNPSIGDGGR